MNMTKGLAMALILAISASAAAAKGDKVMTTFDLDKNGQITPTEIVAVRDWMFQQMDLNADGIVQVAEVEDAMQKGLYPKAMRKRQFMAQRDLDRDGKLTLDEYTSVSNLFGVADKDKNGALDADEVAYALDTIGPDALN